MTDTITIPESRRLIQLEKVIEAGQRTFVEVGTALAEIRNDRLYRVDYDTFEEYCRDKWGWNRAHCNQLIAGAATVKSLPEPVATMVSNQRQAREVAQIPEEHRAEAVTKASEKAASEERPITARDIADVAESMAWKPGGLPVKPADHSPEDDESDAVFGLKRYWKKANKKERKQFMDWAQLTTKTKKGKSK